MSKVYLICGVICSGKSTLTRELGGKHRAITLSCDELTKAVGDDLGAAHDAIALRLQRYLRDKAVELTSLGLNVILDWGFWRASDRAEMTRFLEARGVDHEWHYMDVSWAQLERNIDRRNACPGPSDYVVDAGLLDKCLSAFEPPAPGEMDFVHVSPNC